MANFNPSGAGLVLLPDYNFGVDNSGRKTLSFLVSGDYETLDANLTAAGRGGGITGASSGPIPVSNSWKIDSWQLRHSSGGYGIATVNCVQGDLGAGGSSFTPALLKETWHVKSCRNDVSIYAYCGVSAVDGSGEANRADLEMWRAEKNPTLYNDGKFKDSNDVVHELNDTGKAIADKIKRGIESVMRFYPQVIRKRTYDSFPPGCMENIGFINAPSATGHKLSSFLSLYQWLKIQDDADENGDRTWTRTESWIGILLSSVPTGKTPWDADLYGSSRWKMPYDATPAS